MDIVEIIERMSPEEKVAFCSGKDEWHTKGYPQYGIPSIMMSDGPNGLRKQLGAGDILGIEQSEKSTCFPTVSLVACSFDKDLVGELSSAIAQEAGAAGIAVFLGPGVNIKRNPLCGRNFEYFSEDPFLAGKLGAAYISAAQKSGIGTSLKHFACNSQEYFRMVSDSILDERTLREIYLTAFEYSVKEGKPASVMCAYNKINGIFCSDYTYLLTDILRKDWGFDGFVVTDWGAINDRSASFEAGCDLVMPGGNAYGEDDTLRNIKKGRLSLAYVDQSVARILRFVENAQKTFSERSFSVDQEKHHELARRIAEGSAVLLKNDDELLPCSPDDIVIIGQMAKEFRYQGHGSSRINPTKVDDVLSLLPAVPYAPGYDAEGNTNDALLAEAVALARTAKKVVILAGLPDIAEVEGIDRENMKMPAGQNRLIHEVVKANPNVAVVLCCGCAVETPWADEVKAILYVGLSGQAGAGALVNLLAGKVNPGGRLAETWPVKYEDCPNAPFYANGRRDAEYREGIYVGYRYYEKAGIPVRFPFGAGLSYTSFAYRNLYIKENRVCVTVTNTGDRDGSEVVLFYIHAPQEGMHRPVRELKGFEKIKLAPGESKEVFFDLDHRSFAVWNGGWKTYAGEYKLQVGTEMLSIQVGGEVDKEPTDRNNWYYSLHGMLPRNDWINILGWQPAKSLDKPYTINSTVADILKDSFIIRLIYKEFEKMQAKASGRGSVNYQVTMRSAVETPLRNVQNSYMLKGHFAQALADFGNKKILQGLWHLIY